VEEGGRGGGKRVAGGDGSDESQDAPFRSEHQDAGESKFEEGNAAPGVQHGAQLEAAPRLVPRVGRGVGGVYDEEEEREGEGARERDGRAVEAKIGMVHKVDVERDVDGGDENEHVSGRVHDSWREVRVNGMLTEENI
jgi:hypothetical protein